MLTMDDYKTVDRILPNWLEPNDLIKVKGEVYEVINLRDTPTGWDIIVLDNYQETKIISVPDDKHISVVLPEHELDSK